ncbi:MAG: glycosyltransferase family 9 protein [Rhodospirillaceae bacterium]|nr:glycosyltransferase family 9 protein [Rhodospirillaceae bacterium]
MEILFITHTRIGDAVLSSGVLRHLVEAHSDARITVVCGPLAATLFAAVPRSKTIVMTKEPFDGHWLKLWKAVRATRWNLVVDLRRSLLSYFLSAKERRVLGPADDSIHRVRYLSSVLNLTEPAAPFLYTTPAHHAAARDLIPDGAPVLAVSPVAATVAKTWPAERFAGVINAATAPSGVCAGWRVMLFGSPADRAQVEPLVARLSQKPLRLFDEPDLLTVHAALARCGRFLGNDSGLAHLAAAAGIPVLSLFGPTDPIRYAPWGPAARTLRSPDGVIAHMEESAVLAALT